MVSYRFSGYVSVVCWKVWLIRMGNEHEVADILAKNVRLKSFHFRQRFHIFYKIGDNRGSLVSIGAKDSKTRTITSVVYIGNPWVRMNVHDRWMVHITTRTENVFWLYYFIVVTINVYGPLYAMRVADMNACACRSNCRQPMNESNTKTVAKCGVLHHTYWERERHSPKVCAHIPFAFRTHKSSQV